MDGSSVIFIVMPIVIPLVIFAGIALPYLADSRSGRKDRDMHTTFAARQGSGPVGREDRRGEFWGSAHAFAALTGPALALTST